jgi:hypothetical protein
LQVQGELPQMLQPALAEIAPQAVQPHPPLRPQVLQWPQPQLVLFTPQGAQGLQAGVPSLSTQPQL